MDQLRYPVVWSVMTSSGACVKSNMATHSFPGAEGEEGGAEEEEGVEAVAEKKL